MFPYLVNLHFFLSVRQLKEQKEIEDPKTVNLKVYNRDMESPDSSGYVRTTAVYFTFNVNLNCRNMLDVHTYQLIRRI